MIAYVCDRCGRSFETPKALHRLDVDGQKHDCCEYCTGLAKRAVADVIQRGKDLQALQREEGREVVRQLRRKAKEATDELNAIKEAIAAAAPVAEAVASAVLSPGELEQAQQIATSAQQLQDQGADPATVAKAIVDAAYAAVERGEPGFAVPLEPLELEQPAPAPASQPPPDFFAPDDGPGGV